MNATKRIVLRRACHGKNGMIGKINQFKTEPCIPNQDERWVIRILWSMVLKTADRSWRQRHDDRILEISDSNAGLKEE